MTRAGRQEHGREPDGRSPGHGSGRWEWAALVSLALILCSPFIYLQRDSHRVHPRPVAENHFIGSRKCGACHAAYFDKWQNSHHDLAMDVATEETVLGDFENAAYTDPHNRVTSRFYRENGKFMVETEGPDGELGIFEVTHTFGVYPLQQYLIPFPGGRLQCLNIAWNSRDSTWYRVPPYDVDGAGDWLHWTRGGQTWNGMCAECHSTNLVKNFNMGTDTYETTWFEIDVGCEACHGPGSIHARWAEKPALAREKLDSDGLTVDTSQISSRQMISICAPCHARRYQLGDNLHEGGDVLDVMVPSLLDEGLYYPDGQILEEVYVYGSFVQSKMYAHDVRCSDCHDVHSLEPHKDGNDLCLQCHRAAEYDRYEHHFHKREFEGRPSDGHLCVKCHMPGRIYMGADYRPDHSLRIPRPDLSAALETPNSCSTAGCHADKPLSWVVDHYNSWYGTSKKSHYGEIFAAARAASPDAGGPLRTLARDSLSPAIVRATALSLLSGYPGAATTETLVASLEDEDSLIRQTAIRGLQHIDNQTRLEVVAPKLYDRVKGVRIEAAAMLASVPKTAIKKEDLAAFAAALEEYEAAMRYNADFAPQRYNLGNLAAAQGDNDAAAAFYEQAVAIDEQFYPAKVNLAMLYNGAGDNAAAEKLLREVVADHPHLHEVTYSLGLLLAELQEYGEAADVLGRAADGMPDYTRPRYNQALALLKLKRYEEGERALLLALEAEPANREYFSTLANLYLGFGMIERASDLADTILEKVPGHPDARQLRQMISNNAKP